jgi:NitT/TauT family transport system substrate-binding protein
MRRKQSIRYFEATVLCITLVLMFGLGSPAATAAPPQVKPEMTKLRIGVSAASLSFLPNWVAERKGLFEREGLTDVKVLYFRGNAPTVQALSAGTIDLCVAALNGLLNCIQSGQKFKAVWAGYNMPIFDWYAQPKYKSIAETKGGRYGVTKFGALTDFLTRFALRNAGLDPEKDAKILQLGGSRQCLAAMESGQLDATILSIPNNYVAAERGFVKLMSQKEHISPDYPTHVVYAKEGFIAQNPNTIKAYLRATSRAMEWIKATPDEAAKVASEVLKFKLDHCRKAIDEMSDGWCPDGRLAKKEQGMKVFWEIAVQAGDVKEPWPDSKWLDDTFLKTQDQWRK